MLNRIIIFGVFMCFKYSLLAQKDSIYQFPEVEVKAEQNKSIHSLTPVTVLKKENLEKLNTQTVADGVRSMPGVVLKDYGGIGGLKTVSVRSLGAEHTAVFVDGVKMSDKQTGQIDLGKLLIDNVEQIELHKGEPDELYQNAQAYASAHVLLLTTQSYQFDKDTHNVKIGGSFQHGSFGLFSPSFYIHKKVGEKGFVGLTLKRVQANGTYSFITENNEASTTLSRENADVKTTQGEFDFGKKLGLNSTLKLKAYYYNSERGLPGANTLYNPYSSQRLWNEDYFVQAHFKKDLNKKVGLKAYGKFSSNWLRYLDPDYLNTAGELDDRYLQNEYYGSAVVGYKINKRIHIATANDFSWNTLKSNLYQFATPTRFTWLSALNAKGYFQKLKVDASLLSTFVEETTQTGQSAPRKRKLSPSLSIGYKPFFKHNIHFRTSYKNIFRLPTFNDLYYIRVGNSNLRPETANQLNTGITYGKYNWGLFEQVVMSTDFFKAFVKDKIIAVPTKNLFIWSMRNLGVVHTTGIEYHLDFKVKLPKHYKLGGYFNYTYQEALDKTNEQMLTYNHQIAYTPFQTAAGGASIERKTLSLNWNMVYSGFRYALGENIQSNLLSSWTTHDLGIGWKKEFNKYTMSIKTEINNILDTPYEVIKSFPMPGRNYRITLKIEFK